MRENLISKNKILLICILIFLFGFIGLLCAGCFTIESNNVLGIILLSLSGAFIIGEIISIILCVKNANKIGALEKEKFFSEIKIVKNNNSFETIEGQKIMFLDSKIIIDDQEYRYNDFEYIYSAVSIRKIWKDEKFICLSLINQDKVYNVKLDGDVLRIINELKIKIQNFKDYNFFINNYDKCIKKINMNFAFANNPINIVPLVFAKNDEEKKQERKFNRVNIIIYAAIIVVFFGIFTLFTWLTKNENGIEFSKLIGFDYIILGGYVVIMLLMFILNKPRYNIYQRLMFLIYLLYYCLGKIFLPTRILLLIEQVWGIAFLIVGLFILKKKYNGVNRFIIWGVILLFITYLYVFGLGYGENINLVYITSAIIGGCAALIFIAITMYLLFIKNIKFNKNKGNKYNAWSNVGYSFGVVMMTFLFCSGEILILNYGFSNDKNMIEHIAEIVSINRGGTRNPPSLYVLVNDEKIGIEISMEDYYILENFEYVKIEEYIGAFNLNYYIYIGPVEA